jgi:hypothetical protein
MPESYEPLLAFIAAQLSRPVSQREEENGTLIFTGGHPPEVIVCLKAGIVVVAEYSLRWNGPHTATVRPITIGSVKWRREKRDAGGEGTHHRRSERRLARRTTARRPML